jgi:hypothetical protein
LIEAGSRPIHHDDAKGDATRPAVAPARAAEIAPWRTSGETDEGALRRHRICWSKSG